LAAQPTTKTPTNVTVETARATNPMRFAAN
jgi:hypothetical protein